MRVLVLTFAVFGFALGAFSLIHHGGGGVPWSDQGRPFSDYAGITVGVSYAHGMVVQGSTPVAPGENLFLVYADGARERLEVTPWVSKPIRMGLYHHVIPRVHRAYSRRPIAVELVHGTRTVARQVVTL